MTDDFSKQLTLAVAYLRSFARALTCNTESADGLVQAALARNRVSRPPRHDEPAFRASMLATLREIFIDEGRREASHETRLDDSISAGAMTNGATRNSHIEFEEAVRAYWQLTTDQREVLMLVGALGLGYDEAAGVLSCTVRTLRSRLSHARDELERQIQQGAGLISQDPAFYDI